MQPSLRKLSVVGVCMQLRDLSLERDAQTEARLLIKQGIRPASAHLPRLELLTHHKAHSSGLEARLRGEQVNEALGEGDSVHLRVAHKSPLTRAQTDSESLQLPVSQAFITTSRTEHTPA